MKNLIIFATTTALLIFLTSCGVVKEGFGSPKKENSDEFLVEKKCLLKCHQNSINCQNLVKQISQPM